MIENNINFYEKLEDTSDLVRCSFTYPVSFWGHNHEPSRKEKSFVLDHIYHVEISGYLKTCESQTGVLILDRWIIKHSFSYPEDIFFSTYFQSQPCFCNASFLICFYRYLQDL